MIYERYYGGEQGGRNNFGSEGDCASLPSIVVRSRSHQFVAARLHHNTTHTGRRQLFASTARRYVDTKSTHTIGLQENSSYNTIWFLQGCVRGHHGRGQGQGQIISRPRTPMKSLFNRTNNNPPSISNSTPYCYSSVLTTQSFAYLLLLLLFFSPSVLNSRG